MPAVSHLHKVFISYHHEFDQDRKNIFELRFGNSFGAIIPGAVGVGDIDANVSTETIRQKIRDEYLRDTSVTVVLVGALTWQRKHVDWEIGSSIRDTRANPRSGLLGILLPSYYEAYYDGRQGRYDPHTIPPRLHDNVEVGFATLHNWTEDAGQVRTWVHDAYLRKGRVEPTNARPSFAKNRSGSRWS